MCKHGFWKWLALFASIFCRSNVTDFPPLWKSCDAIILMTVNISLCPLQASDIWEGFYTAYLGFLLRFPHMQRVVAASPITFCRLFVSESAYFDAFSSRFCDAMSNLSFNKSWSFSIVCRIKRIIIMWFTCTQHLLWWQYINNLQYFCTFIFSAIKKCYCYDNILSKWNNHSCKTQ